MLGKSTNALQPVLRFSDCELQFCEYNKQDACAVPVIISSDTIVLGKTDKYRVVSGLAVLCFPCQLFVFQCQIAVLFM